MDTGTEIFAAYNVPVVMPHIFETERVIWGTKEKNSDNKIKVEMSLLMEIADG
jgi:hypothetical protein